MSVRLDRGRLLELGAVALFMPGETDGLLVNLIGGEKGPLTSGALKGGRRGWEYNFNGTSQATNLAVGLPDPAAGTSLAERRAGFTVLARFRVGANASNNPAGMFGIYAASGTQGGFGVGWSTSAQVGAQELSGSGAGMGAYSAGAVGSTYTVAAYSPGSTSSAWINGAPAATNQGSSTASQSGGAGLLNEISVGGQHRSSGFLRYANGDIEWGAVLYGVEMTDALAARLFAQDFPYNLLQRRRKRALAVAGGTDALTATGIGSATGVGSPALGQVHDLAATGIGSATGVGAPALGQVHDLTATTIGSAAGVGAPALGQVHDLTATGIGSATGVGAPALGQVHDLTATAIGSAAGVGAPALGQLHDLAATGIGSATGVGAPTLSESQHDLTATGIGSATGVGAPAIGQAHSLTATPVGGDSGVGSPALEQVHGLTATGIGSASGVGAPALSEGNGLIATPIGSATGVGTPTIGQVHALIAAAFSVETGVGTPALGQVHALTGSGIGSQSGVGFPALNPPVVTLGVDLRRIVKPARPRRPLLAPPVLPVIDPYRRPRA